MLTKIKTIVASLLLIACLSGSSVFAAAPGRYFEFAPSVGLRAAVNPMASWYNAAWLYRVKVTSANAKVDADLTNFPVLVKLGDLPAGFHANCNQTDARDIRVTTADGVTELPREVVFYNAATDTGEMHFKADALANATDTNFYIYYGNAAATEPAANATYGSQNVWDSNFKGVYHFGDGTTVNVADSTSNANNATNNGTTAGSGVVGGGAQFNGTSQYITLPNSFTGLNTAEGTIEAWINMTARSATIGEVIDFRVDGNNEIELVNIDQNFGGYDFRFARTAGGVTKLVNDATILDNGTNIAVAMSWSSAADQLKGYKNGAQSGTTQTTLGTFTGTPSLNKIGNNAFNQYFQGMIDEVRISATPRTATWLSTTYNNQSSPATFYTVGAQEAKPSSGFFIFM